MCGISEDALVEATLARIPPAPQNHHRIVKSNEVATLWEGDPTGLETGVERRDVTG